MLVEKELLKESHRHIISEIVFTCVNIIGDELLLNFGAKFQS